MVSSIQQGIKKLFRMICILFQTNNNYQSSNLEVYKIQKETVNKQS